MSRARSINELEVLAHLMICLAADRSVEKDGADANADIDTGASAPAPPPLEIDAWPPPQRLGTAYVHRHDTSFKLKFSGSS